MANEQNLKPNTERTPSERKALAAKAGKASGEARRAKKTLREYALALLDAETTLKDGSKKSNREMILLAQFKKAVQDGDLNSAKWLGELVGETPAKQLELTGKDGAALNPEPIQIQVITDRKQVVKKEEEEQ